MPGAGSLAFTSPSHHGFRGRGSIDCKGVNVGFQEFADRFVDETMSSERREATERGGHDPDLVMAMSAGSAAVSDVPLAIIQDLEFDGREGRHEASAQPGLPRCCGGIIHASR